MGGSTPKAPKAPDPAKVIPLQTQSNIETARKQAELNRLNEVGPFGTLTYNQTPGTDQWTRTTQLDPLTANNLFQQQAAAGEVGLLARNRAGALHHLLADPLDTDYSAERQRIEDALFARLEPRIQQDRDRLEQMLANQGAAPGHEIYGRQQGLFQQGVNDARLATILNAGQEQNRLQGLEFAQRSQGLNELLGLIGGQQVQLPQYAGAGQSGVAPTDVVGPYNTAYQGALNNYNQQLQQQGQTRSDLFGLAGALGGAAILSSKALKHDIEDAEPALERLETLPVKVWRYKPEVGQGDDRHMGPMAEDWAERFGGDGTVIHIMDALGVMMKSIQELSAKVSKLEAAHGHHI